MEGVFIALYRYQVGEVPPEKPVFKENTEVTGNLALQSDLPKEMGALGTPCPMFQADGPARTS